MKTLILPHFLLVLFAILRPIQGFAQLEFIENQGQWQSEYGLRAKMKYGDLWLSNNKIAFALTDFGGKEKGKDHVHANPEKALEHHYTMELLGTQSAAKVLGEDKKTAYHNYYLGEEKYWRTSVPLFEKARQKDVYPGTDMVWKEEKGSLKYEFELKDARHAAQIKIQYKGLNSIELKNGNLVLKTTLGTITEQKPIAFQIVNHQKKIIPCQFKKLNNNTIGFAFPLGYQAGLPLVIDPVLIFSTFSGSRSDNWGFTATYGENGVTYSGGIVLGTRFPKTPGAYQPTYAGDSIGTNIYSTFDIGILKFNATGTNLLFATYLGGSEAEVPASMVVDANNNLIVLGASGSSNFPTTQGAYDRTYNGGQNVSPYGPSESIVRFRLGSDIIISKFSENGSQLLGSTFLGGSANDGVLSLTSQGDSPLVRNYGDSFRGEVAVDSLGNIYLASHTRSTNFPTVTPLQATKGAGFDGICARFNSNLTALQFSTFLGGNADDGAFSIQVASPTLVYLCGGTSSTNFPRTTNGLNTSYQGGHDGFVCRFNPSGGINSLRSTYLGTNSFDQAFFVQLDKQKKVYVFGQSTGGYPVEGEVYSNPNSSQFIHCLSPTLDSTRFSTVFGNGNPSLPNISPTAFLVDDCGRIYCSGWGGSINNLAPDYINGNTFNLPTTEGAFSQTTDGSDFYLIALEKNAQALSFATYFGNSSSGTEHVDGGTSRFDKKGIVYQAVCAGCGGSSLFPTTPGVWSPNNQSTNCNNAVFKYDFSLLKARFQPSAIQACAPAVIQFTSTSVYATQYQWNFGQGLSNVFTNLDTISHVFDSAGVFQIKLVAINNDACPSLDSTVRTITIQKAPALLNDSLRFCSFQDTLQLPSLPAGTYTYSWSPATYLTSANIRNPKIIQPQGSLIYTATVSTSFGCSNQATFKLSNGILKAGLSADTLRGCFPFSPVFQNISYQGKDFTWFWGTGDSLQNNSPTQTYTYTQPGVYPVIIKARNDTTCLTTDTDTLLIEALPSPVAHDTTLRFCNTLPFQLLPGANGGTSYSWSPGNLLNDSTLANPTITIPANQLFTLTVINENQCKSVAKVKLRDGTLKANFNINLQGNCVPTSLLLDNISDNAQISRWIWDQDSTDVSGNGIIPLAVTQPGKVTIRLKVLSDTACQLVDEIEKSVVLGGIPELLLTEKAFCPGDSILLSAIQGIGYQYTWPGFVQIGETPDKALFIGGKDSLRFEVFIKDSLECPGQQTFILIPRKPDSGFISESNFEKCDDVLRYRFQAKTPGLDSYKWMINNEDFSGFQVFYTFPERKNYEAQLIVNRNNCLDTTKIPLTINDPPIILSAEFQGNILWKNCLELPVIDLKNTSEGAEKYEWVIGDDSVSTNLSEIQAKAEGELRIKLKAKQGDCMRETTRSFLIRKLDPPNLITRNGDDKNEKFVIPGLPVGSSLEIRNRWGASIYQSNDYKNDWQPAEKDSTYFYRLQLPEGNSCQGWILVSQ